MEKISFEELGINLPFRLAGTDGPVKVKIDESRYINIGNGEGATCLSPDSRKNLMVNPL